MPHELSFEDLVDHVEGRLTPADAARTRAHIDAGCMQCAADVAWLQHTMGLMVADRLADAPARAVCRAQALYRPPRRRRSLSWAALAPLWRGLCGPRLRPAVAAGLVLLMVVASMWAWGETSVAQAATLSEVQGPVEVRLSGSESWQPAAAGAMLSAGCAVRAGEGGRAVILYADGSRSYLVDSAEVQLLELSGRRNQGRTTIRLSQSAGHTQHQLASPASYLQVQVGDARAEASAAIYDVWVSGGEMDVVASQGQVLLKNDRGKAGLREGEHGHAAEGSLEVSKPEPAATAPGQGLGRGQSQSSKADAHVEPKPERALVPLPVTPGAREHTPPGKPEAKDAKPPKGKAPRLHWPWSRQGNDS